jgi:iron complex transport system substrate-binding protein
MTSLRQLSLRRRELLAAFGALMIPRVLRAADAARLVVAGGALTEIVVALGAGSHIVGVDTTSLYPATLAERLPKIGYLRTLSAEGILSLNPSMLVVSDQAGPPGVLDQLRAVKLSLAIVPETRLPTTCRRKSLRLRKQSAAGRRAQRWQQPSPPISVPRARRSRASGDRACSSCSAARATG